MAEKRIDLEEAGSLLGLHPNSVRARVKKGKYRSETDNAGKIWVFIDPEKIANDRGSMKPTTPALKPSIEPEMKVTIQALVGALEGHIETLKGEKKELQNTVDDLRARLDLSEAERGKLLDAMLEKPAPVAPQIAPEPPKRRWWWFR